ncbi:expressed unknown protein [Seminavis robusta]|uniref:PDZ domain-containing protein n=1 Tax=Seminavis robusta TaxID=568900 RepID=A0A9N8DF70_9STRA|nr:expressed unknown protein [Seminavis robusta]|eukprot:Sro120_g058670.1 n/a (235) ;mRNA; r:98852-99556
MMKSILVGGVLGLLIPLTTSFTTIPTVGTQALRSTSLFGIAVDDIEDVGYYAKIKKPLGVVFGENKEPYLGLRVDDVELGSAGGAAGLRVGDQLMAVNDVVVIGNSFDEAMGLLQSSPAKMTLLLYRGSVRDVYNILNKRGIEADSDGGEEEVIMDENYESPVRVEVVPEENFDFMKAFSKLTGGGAKRDQDDDDEYIASAPPKQEKKKGGGLFGMFGESIQLDGDDATGTKIK